MGNKNEDHAFDQEKKQFLKDEEKNVAKEQDPPKIDIEKDQPKQKRSFFSLFKVNPAQTAQIKAIENITFKEDELWDEVGLHKPLGGQFFRNFTFMLIGAIIGVVTFTFVIGQLIPFPISKGYYDISQGIFAFVFMIFDIGTAYGIERFIGEYMVKDKRKMMKYVQFYIAYQLWTGLIQVTFISWWILTTVPQGNLAHLTWILLIINMKQYPGMLGTFSECLKGMQQYDKTIILDFIGTQGFQFITQIIFFLGGRYYGMAHPEIGELLGLSIGMVLGYYVDDFFSMGLAMYYFGKVAKKMGFRARDAWGHDFDKEIIKECLIFGIGVSWAPLIGVGIGLIKLSMSLNEIPGYANWIILAGLGAGIGQVINMGGDVDIRSVMSESINNNKKELSAFYLGQVFKYWCFVLFAMGAIIIVLLPVVDKIIGIIPSVKDQYEMAIIFIVPGMIAMLPDVPKKHLERVITASGKVWLKSGLEFAMNILNLVLWWAFLYVWRVWEWGTIGIILLFVWSDLLAKIITVTIYIVYVKAKIIPIRILWYQTVGAPLLAFGVIFLIGYAFVYAMVLPLLYFNMAWLGNEIGLIVTGVFAILVILIGFLIFVFPFLYALFGGWDSFGLEVLRKSYLLSGPSKPFILVLYKLSVIGSRLSPLFNKYTLDFSAAFKEAEELLKLKHGDQVTIKNELQSKGNIRL